MENQDPFINFNISEKWKLLDNVKERTPCLKCKKSRKYFCYTCCLPVPYVKNIIPEISLPFKIDIVKHRREIDGKSTAVHAVVLAPNHVSMFQYPNNLPNYSYDDDKTILIYPGKNSITLKKYFEINPFHISSMDEIKNSFDDYGTIPLNGKCVKLPFNKVVFVDGTWNQSKAIYGCFKYLPCIMLQSRASQFWRHQKNSPRWYLATIEAIHQLLCEILQLCCETFNESADQTVQSEYDNLLFFFRYMYHIIHSYYDHNSLLSYRRPFNM